MKPIAILNNGSFRRMEPGFLKACGGDQETVFAAAGGVPASAFVGFDIEAGEALPDPAQYSGVILTGSAAMITDRHPWAEAEAAWVRKHHGKLPMLGVCFGHQMLAHALGGEVADTPTGPEYGTFEVALTPEGLADPLFTGMPPRFPAQSAHSQSVIALPAAAKVLATGASGVQAARFGGESWGLQFHPEFGAGVMRGLFESYRDHYLGLGLDVDRLTADLRETGPATSFVQRFVRHCTGGRGRD